MAGHHSVVLYSTSHRANSQRYRKSDEFFLCFYGSRLYSIVSLLFDCHSYSRISFLPGFYKRLTSSLSIIRWHYRLLQLLHGSRRYPSLLELSLLYPLHGRYLSSLTSVQKNFRLLLYQPWKNVCHFGYLSLYCQERLSSGRLEDALWLWKFESKLWIPCARRKRSLIFFLSDDCDLSGETRKSQWNV